MDDYLQTLKPKLTDVTLQLDLCREELRETKSNLKHSVDESSSKDDEIHRLQVDNVTVKRASEHDLSQKAKEIEVLTDQYKYFKKYGETQKEGKEKLKKKLKETEKSKEELKQ